jgi:hypothetical protein
MIVFSHTWTGTEPLQGSLRLFRDGMPSMAGTQKPFPGTVANNPTWFTTLLLDVEPGSVVSGIITATSNFSFLSIYESPFNHTSLATNYLGDAGSSLAGIVFSITTPASGNVVVVGNSVFSTDAIGQSFSANVTFTPRGGGAVPELSALALAALGAAGLLGYVWHRRRTTGT